MDLTNVTFNQNYKAEAAARDAATGVRQLLLAFALGVAIIGVAFAAKEQAGLSLLLFALYLTCFAAGAYGSYLAASALDWSGFITAAVILGALIPYLRLVCFAVLIAFSLELIRKAGYRFSLMGAMRKRDSLAPDASAEAG